MKKFVYGMYLDTYHMIMSDKKAMNILYAIDEKRKDYSRYLGVSILSLLENNKDENINIYILSEYLEESNKQELIRIVEKYGKKIIFSKGEIVSEKFKKVLWLKGKRPISTYYRFFFLDKFDIKDRVLYLDCDTIVNKNLSDFYYSDFEGNTIIGQPDFGMVRYRQTKLYGLNNYINAGVILINIELFKEVDIYNGVTYFNEEYGIPDYNDQDYINIIFKDKIKTLNNIQLIACFYFYSNYSDYYIVHTTQKPNAGGYEYCPKKVEQLFNKYLEQTKWKTWIGYKKHISIREYCNYLYDFITKCCAYTTYNIFGPRAGTIVTKIFWSIYNGVFKCTKIFKK